MSPREIPPRPQSKAGQLHTDLRPLELVQVLVRAEQALDGLDVLFLLEAGEGIEVVDGLGEDLGLLEALAVVATLCDQRVDNERGLGERERVDVLELAEDNVGADILVARGQGLGSRCLLATGSSVLLHGGLLERLSVGVERTERLSLVMGGRVHPRGLRGERICHLGQPQARFECQC